MAKSPFWTGGVLHGAGVLSCPGMDWLGRLAGGVSGSPGPTPQGACGLPSPTPQPA